MAEGGTQGSFSVTFSKASGDADEIFCEPCTNGGKWVAVEGYCKICEEFMCSKCAAVHKNQKMTRGHMILDRNQMPKTQAPSSIKDLCVEVCKTHHPEIVRFYCKSHDETGCVDCMSLNHTSCKKDRVQDISAGFQATEEFKLVRENLNRFHEELETMQDTLDEDLENLDKTYKNIEEAITAFRTQVNDYLDQIQKEIMDKLAKLKKRHGTDREKLISQNEAMKSELEDTLQRIQNLSNANSMFVITKQGKQLLDTMENEFHKMEQSYRLQQQQQQYMFHPSSEIGKLIATKTPLGKLSSKPNINMTASYRGNIYVKIGTEKRNCWINDCVLLSPDRLVLTDGLNNKIKLIDLSDNTVISSYNLSNEPCGITAISKDKVAVTIPKERIIRVLTAAHTLIKLHSINVDNNCYGITYYDGKLGISYTNPSAIQIMDMHGKVLWTIQPKRGNEDALKNPFFIKFGLDKDTVIVSDSSTNEISVITFTGQILQTYTHDALQGPRGIVLTADGILFVCSYKKSSVHVVSPDFKSSKIIISNDEKVMHPVCITYNYRLYISNNGIGQREKNNSIQVYDLKV